MIRQCDENDIGDILAIINDGAQAYRGVIPDDCWTQPYMAASALRHEVDSGVKFWGWQAGDERVGEDEKKRLLGKYWTIPARQVEASVVLAENG